jgi:hypothetical protein
VRERERERDKEEERKREIVSKKECSKRLDMREKSF